MEMTKYIAIAIMILIIAVLLYYGFIHFIKNKNLKNGQTESSIDIDKFLEALGGIDNISDVSHSPSKVTVILKNQSVVNIGVIQALGASGIVEGKETLSMIFGKQSALIAQDIKERM